MRPPGLAHLLLLQPLQLPLAVLQVKHGVLVADIATRRLVELGLEGNFLNDSR